MSPRDAATTEPAVARPISRLKVGISPIAPLVGTSPLQLGPSPTQSAVSGQLKILILEDDPADAEQMQHELRKGGLNFIVKLVATREDFIEALETFAPDVVLADCHLPGYSGAEALAHERHVHPEIPVVIVTGTIGDEAAIELLKAGAKDYVLKSNLLRLPTAVERVISVEEGIRARKAAERALRAANTLLQATERIAHIGGFEWDVVHDTVVWSEETYRIHGYSAEEYIPSKKGFLACVHPEDRERVAASIAATVERDAPFDIECRIVRPDGGERFINTRGELTRDETGKPLHLTGTSHDITERKESERTLRRVNRALRALSGGNEVLVRATSESELLEQTCRVIVDLGGYRMAWIGMAQRDAEKSVRPVAWAGERTEFFSEQMDISWADSLRGRGTTGTAIRDGEPQISQHIATDPRMSPWAALAREYGIAATASLPLKDHSGVFAVLVIYAVEPNAFDADELRLLQELASDLSFGIGAIRERTGRELSDQRWRTSLEATVGAIASTVEMRDQYTAGHQQRVAKLAVAVARRLSMSEHDIQGIYLAGIIHDVGKISIPAEILSKPGKLSEIEFQLIKTHAQAGYDIIKGVEFPWPIAQLVLQHHERLDGSGYPQGLRGDAMLGGAKILAVADVVEAMMSHRPYRPALGIDVALAEIEKGKGTLFDPEAVDACVSLFHQDGFHFD